MNLAVLNLAAVPETLWSRAGFESPCHSLVRAPSGFFDLKRPYTTSRSPLEFPAQPMAATKAEDSAGARSSRQLSAFGVIVRNFSAFRGEVTGKASALGVRAEWLRLRDLSSGALSKHKGQYHPARQHDLN